MIASRTVRFRIDEEQYQQLLYRTKLKGFKTVSEYLRYVSLVKPLELEDMIIQIYNRVVNNENS